MRIRDKKEVECSQCGKTYLRNSNHADAAKKNGWKQFCSRECLGDSRKSPNSIDTTCHTCGEQIHRTISEQNRSKSGYYFCSRSCATVHNNSYKKGDKHPNWNGGRYRQNAFDHYGKKCFDCGYDEEEKLLDVHHLDGNRKHNSLENLIVLCVMCHARKTRGLDDIV